MMFLECESGSRVFNGLKSEKCHFTVSDATDPVDERICVSPGQVVDAEILDKLLKQPEHCRIFYGPGNVSNR